MFAACLVTEVRFLLRSRMCVFFLDTLLRARQAQSAASMLETCDHGNQRQAHL